MEREKIIVSLLDADIYRRDVELLQTGQWLNDAVINYCLRRLELRFPSFLLFMDPSIVSFLRLQCEECEEWDELANALLLPSRKWLIVPVNDNEAFDGVSSHWSLLVLYVPNGKLLHFDSFGCYNHNAAVATAEKLFFLLKRTDIPQVERAIPSPQQNNNCDCGVFLLLTAEWLANEIITTETTTATMTNTTTSHSEGTSSSSDVEELALFQNVADLCGRLAIAVNPASAETFRQDTYTSIVRSRLSEESFIVDRKL